MAYSSTTIARLTALFAQSNSHQTFQSNIFTLKAKSFFCACLSMLCIIHSPIGIAQTSPGKMTINGQTINYSIEVLTDQLDHPWSLDFMPGGDLIISERAGHLRIWHQGKLSEPLKNAPQAFVKGQGGFFDVLLDPDFANTQRIFLSLASGNAKQNATQLVSARLRDNQLVDIKILLTVTPTKDTPVHYGGRLAILPDKTLLMTTGDGFDYREKAQDLNGLLGKVLRVNFDGSIPADNPFFNNPSARNEIFSYGHRNPQGIIYDPVRQKIFMHEHGPMGGDELNWLQAGKNYGWPVATFGKDYSGASISPYTEYPGMEPPIVDWTPSIAPSGMAVYYGVQFPELNGDFLVGALKFKQIRLVKMQGDKVAGQQVLFAELGERIRDVRIAPDGAIYILTDSDQGQLIRITRENISNQGE